MQLLTLEHTFFFLLWAWCAGWLVAGLLSDGDGSDETGFPAQAFLLFLLLQVLQDVLRSLMGTWHSSGWKWLLSGSKEKKHSLKLLVNIHTRCVFCQRPQWHSAAQFLNINQTSATEIDQETSLGAMSAISLGADFSQETPHEPVQRKWSVRQFKLTNVLSEKDLSYCLSQRYDMQYGTSVDKQKSLLRM